MNINIPMYYDHANVAKAMVTPSNIKPRDNAVVWYYTKYLLKRAMSVFKWKVPATWDKDFFLYCLYCWGNVAVIDTPTFGVIPQPGTLSGYDIFYRPDKIMINNPRFPQSENKMYDLHKDAVLIKLQPDYTGLLDVCSLYATRLSYIHEALFMNLINSKLAYVFLTDNKSAAQTFKKLFDDVQRGEPAVVAGNKLRADDGSLLWDQFTNNLKQNYISTDLLNDMRSVLNDFCAMVGIPSANTTKRERLVVDEVNANNIETETLPDLMLETLQLGIDEAVQKYGIDLSVKKRYDTAGGTTDETNTNDTV